MTERTLQDITKSYLEDLYSATFLGKCAGKVTQLPLLHKNKVKNEELQHHSLELLKVVIDAFVEEEIRLKINTNTLTQEDLIQVHKIIKDFDFIIFNLDEMSEMKKMLEPYFDGIQRLFYYLKSDDGAQILEKIQPYIHESDLETLYVTEGSNRFPEYFDFELNFEKELLMNGNVDLEIAHKNGFWINGPPLGIYGNPGFGKTIYLRQLAHGIVDRALEKGPQQYTEIPFFFKAKVLAKYLSEFGTRKYEDFCDESGSQITYNGLGANDLSEFEKIFTMSALFTEPDLDAKNLDDLFMKLRETSFFTHNMVIIIDAMDECGSRDDRYSIAKFLSEFSEFVGIIPKIVFTCRHEY